MEYNDFQLFDNNTFSILQSEYQHKPSIDRKTIVNKIYLELENIKNYCITFPLEFNKKIINALSNFKTEISKLLDSLKTMFNINTTNNTSYHNFNLFKLLKKLLKLILLFYNWLQIEEKEFYKTTINNSIKSLTISSVNIIQACEDSEIKFFKFM